MKFVKFIGRDGRSAEYPDYGKAVPPYPKSNYITAVRFDKHRYHWGEGDMWPVTWGADDNLYTAAGDNKSSPMNFWKIGKNRWSGGPLLDPDPWTQNHTGYWRLDMVDELPLDPQVYCTHPLVDRHKGLKPAGLLDIGGTLYFAVEAQNYGTEPTFNRQTNIHGWIVTTANYGRTWNREATPTDFFTGRLASCHFLQFGRGYEGARDQFVYGYFPSADDGKSYWENGDYMLLGRVHKGRILDRGSWEFYTGVDAQGRPIWNSDDTLANPVFRYDKMTGADSVFYNKDIRRYILGNYSFVDDELRPRPYHQGVWPDCACRSQMTLYEAPEPWGPWSLFHQDDNWGTYGDYHPVFPTKWMMEDGRLMLMVSSGSWDDYNFVVQPVALKIAGDADFPEAVKSFDYPPAPNQA
jgi:hypothetical protein